MTLPSVLALRCHLDSSVTVMSAADLAAGTLFGPMVAPHTEHISNHQFPVKVRGGGQILGPPYAKSSYAKQNEIKYFKSTILTS